MTRATFAGRHTGRRRPTATRRTACAALLAFALPAQDPSPARPPAPEVVAAPTANSLLQKLAAPGLTADAARALCEQLDERPLAVRVQRFDAVCRQYAGLLQAFTRNHERLPRVFAKAVPKVQRAAQGRTGEATIATLRSQALAITRGPDLTKERIHHDLDPLLEKLRALVLVDVETACAKDQVLGTAVAGLRHDLDELHEWSSLYVELMHATDADPEGRRQLDQRRQEPEPPAAAGIEQDLECWCLAALPLAPRDQKVLEANLADRATLDREEFLGTLELNRIRIALGLAALRIDAKLGNAARDHSVDMRTRNFFSHDSPVDGKHTPWDRAARAGTSASAENIAAGHDTGRSAITGWWYSPGHHKNMLGNHARTGLGRSEGLWTQLFGG